MKVSDIMYENNAAWVAKQKDCYTVFKNRATHSISVASFEKNADGLSLAISYCQYLGKENIQSSETLQLAKALHK